MFTRRSFLRNAAAAGLAAGSMGAFSGSAHAAVAPKALKDVKFEPLKLPRPISLAALTVLDVSPRTRCSAPQRQVTATSAFASCLPRPPKRSGT